MQDLVRVATAPDVQTAGEDGVLSDESDDESEEEEEEEDDEEEEEEDAEGMEIDEPAAALPAPETSSTGNDEAAASDQVSKCQPLDPYQQTERVI